MRHRPRKSKPAHDYTDAARGERLQKVLAAAGVASRRACEQLIEEGSVKVNGQTVRSLPAWVNPHEDRIEVDGRPIARHRKAAGSIGKEGFVYVALHKPREVIATTSDDLGRLSVMDLVELPVLNSGDASPRLFPVGRLDADATGLIFLTNDGELAHRLTHPSYSVAKEYEVSVRGRVTEADIERIIKGLKQAHRGSRRDKTRPEPDRQGKPTPKKKPSGEVKILGVQRDEKHGDRTTLLVTLNEGPDREVQWVLKRAGFTVRRLKRTAIGPVRLKGISIRNWRMLTPAEVNQLRREVDLGKA